MYATRGPFRFVDIKDFRQTTASIGVRIHGTFPRGRRTLAAADLSATSAHGGLQFLRYGWSLSLGDLHRGQRASRPDLRLDGRSQQFEHGNRKRAGEAILFGPVSGNKCRKDPEISVADEE